MLLEASYPSCDKILLCQSMNFLLELRSQASVNSIHTGVNTFLASTASLQRQRDTTDDDKPLTCLSQPANNSLLITRHRYRQEALHIIYRVSVSSQFEHLRTSRSLILTDISTANCKPKIEAMYQRQDWMTSESLGCGVSNFYSQDTSNILVNTASVFANLAYTLHMCT